MVTLSAYWSKRGHVTEVSRKLSKHLINIHEHASAIVVSRAIHLHGCSFHWKMRRYLRVLLVCTLLVFCSLLYTFNQLVSSLESASHQARAQRTRAAEPGLSERAHDDRYVNKTTHRCTKSSSQQHTHLLHKPPHDNTAELVKTVNDGTVVINEGNINECCFMSS